MQQAQPPQALEEEKDVGIVQLVPDLNPAPPRRSRWNFSSSLCSIDLIDEIENKPEQICRAIVHDSGPYSGKSCCCPFNYKDGFVFSDALWAQYQTVRARFLAAQPPLEPFVREHIVANIERARAAGQERSGYFVQLPTAHAMQLWRQLYIPEQYRTNASGEYDGTGWNLCMDYYPEYAVFLVKEPRNPANPRKFYSCKWAN
jgi:hypothetical protein